MSGRAFEIPRNRMRCATTGLGISVKALESRHLKSISNLFRKGRDVAGLPNELVLHCARQLLAVNRGRQFDM